jgi:type II secretory pathway component PulK
MKRFRLRLSSILWLVALVAVLARGFVLARRSAHYRREALYHSRAAARAAGAKEDYHDRLVKKYKRATYRPWFLLDPDPPDLD